MPLLRLTSLETGQDITVATGQHILQEETVTVQAGEAMLPYLRDATPDLAVGRKQPWQHGGSANDRGRREGMAGMACIRLLLWPWPEREQCLTLPPPPGNEWPPPLSLTPVDDLAYTLGPAALEPPYQVARAR